MYEIWMESIKNSFDKSLSQKKRCYKLGTIQINAWKEIF